MLLKKMATTLSLGLLIAVMYLAIIPTLAFAGYNPQCDDIQKISFDDSYPQGFGDISIRANNLTPGENYFLAIFRTGSAQMWRTAASGNVTYTGSPIELSVQIPNLFFDDAENAEVWLVRDGTVSNQKICQIGTTTIKRAVEVECDVSITQLRTINGANKTCEVMTDSNRCVERGHNLNVQVNLKDPNGNPSVNQRINVKINQDWPCATCYKSAVSNAQGVASINFAPGAYPGQSKTHLVEISLDTNGPDYQVCKKMEYYLSEGECQNDDGSTRTCQDPSGLHPIQDDPLESANPFAICAQITSDTLRSKCETCAGGAFGREGVWTAVGCIKRDPKSIIQSLMQIGLGMGGGVALLSTLAGGFILSTSQGNPQKADQAKEIITNSVIGLLFIIFSVVILQFIGVTIFNIPGFGTV